MEFDRNDHWLTFHKNSYNEFDPPKTIPAGGVDSFPYVPMSETLNILLL